MATLVNSNGNPISGTTAERTAAANLRREIGETYFDTTLGVLLVWNGTTWTLPDGSTALGDTDFGLHRMAWYKVQYDFAVDGGAQGTITPAKTVTLPVGFIIYGGMLEVLTAPTSGGSATIAIQAQAANDIVSAIAYNNAQYTLGRKAIIPVMTAASSVQIASTDKQVKIVIATADLIGGKFNINLVGFMGGV